MTGDDLNRRSWFLDLQPCESFECIYYVHEALMLLSESNQS